MVIRYKFPSTVDEAELKRQKNHPAVKEWMEAVKQNPDVEFYPTSFRTIIQDWENQQELNEHFEQRIANREKNPPPQNLIRADKHLRSAFGWLVGLAIWSVLAAGFYMATTIPPAYIYFPVCLIPVAILALLGLRDLREYSAWKTLFPLVPSEHVFKPILKDGSEASIKLQFQSSSQHQSPDALQRLNAATLSGLNHAFVKLEKPPDYPELKRIVQHSIEEEVQRLEFAVFQTRIIEILPPPYKETPKPEPKKRPLGFATSWDD